MSLNVEDDGWGPALAVIAQMREAEAVAIVPPPPLPPEPPARFGIMQRNYPAAYLAALQQQQDMANQRWAAMRQQNAYPYAMASTRVLFTEEAGSSSVSLSEASSSVLPSHWNPSTTVVAQRLMRKL